MSFVNYHTKEVNCKIVYYGPGLGGKTTNLQYIYQRIHHRSETKMISLNTENERTLFFDFLPLDLGEIRGFKTRFHLYTVPGQIFYEASRRLVLKGIDGLIFVADSQIEKLESNKKSFQELEKNVLELGHTFETLPIVMQWNKRDLPNIMSLEDLGGALNRYDLPTCSGIATTGKGVFDTLKKISKLVLLNLRGGLHEEREMEL